MVKVNIVGSQDTTGPMTVQELEAMAATVISPILDGAYQSGCHTASVWDTKAQANTPKLMAWYSAQTRALWLWRWPLAKRAFPSLSPSK